MASDETVRGAFTQTNDTRPAPGAMNAALGRTGRDLAANDGAGLGPDPMAATDEDTFSGNGGDRTDGDGAVTRRRTNPDISPDERMGLRPTIKSDAAPDVPVNKDLYGA
jgi:hypothetical protein